MTAVLPASDDFSKERRVHWRPKLRPGYFSIKDRLYYLFARKATVRVRDLVEMRWDLVGAPIGTGTLQLEGVPWTNYWLEGNSLIVRLEGFEGWATYYAHLHWDQSKWGSFKSAIEANPDNSVNFNYNYQTWATGQREFQTHNLTETLYVRDAQIEHHMPSNLVHGTPVVITDDTKLITDERDYQLQFYITEPRRRVYFNMIANRVGNPHFARGTVGSPSGAAMWYFTDPSGTHRIPGTGFVGTGIVQVDGTGKLIQDVLVDGGHPMVIEAWARAPMGSGVGYLEVAFKQPGSGYPITDPSGNILSYEPDFVTYSVQQSGAVGSEWTRIAIVLGQGNEFDVADALFPDVCDRLELRMHGSGLVWGAAAVLQDALRAGQYNYVDPNATVEYETDGSGFWKHNPSGAFPYENLWHADMNPSNYERNSGFLSITEDGELSDEDLNIGEQTFGEPYTYGTGVPQGLSPWPSGARHYFGRRHLPYARVRGHNKLRHTQVFDLENKPPSVYEFTVPRASRRPAALLFSTVGNLYRSGTDIKLGMRLQAGSGHLDEVLMVTMVDLEGNPIVHDWVTILPSGQVQVDPSGAFTNEAGSARFNVGPTDGASTDGRLTVTHYKSGVSAQLLTSMDVIAPT